MIIYVIITGIWRMERGQYFFRDVGLANGKKQEPIVCLILENPERVCVWWGTERAGCCKSPDLIVSLWFTFICLFCIAWACLSVFTVEKFKICSMFFRKIRARSDLPASRGRISGRHIARRMAIYIWQLSSFGWTLPTQKFQSFLYPLPISIFQSVSHVIDLRLDWSTHLARLFPCRPTCKVATLIFHRFCWSLLQCKWILYRTLRIKHNK